MSWLILSLCAAYLQAAPGTWFDSRGFIHVNDKPFFPIGIYVYEITPDVMKDCQAKHFNTIIGAGFRADQVDFIAQSKMMCVPFTTDAFVNAGRHHPALLAWYLVDEPESNHTPEKVKLAYAHMKARDADHPIGLCHYLLDALGQFKDGCDFTMTDVYPVTKNRDVPLENVGIHIDRAREVHHNPDWPHWAYIQDFGGPDTDGGKWAQPTPQEVRCMTYIALVHRVQGILYFSYWPKAPQTWESIGPLNQEIQGIVPDLLADGTEPAASSSTPGVEVRARKIKNRWLILAVNTRRTPATSTVHVDGLTGQLHSRDKAIEVQRSEFVDDFEPLAAHIYTSNDH
jgi:hypothetical protein